MITEIRVAYLTEETAECTEDELDLLNDYWEDTVFEALEQKYPGVSISIKNMHSPVEVISDDYQEGEEAEAEITQLLNGLYETDLWEAFHDSGF